MRGRFIAVMFIHSPAVRVLGSPPTVEVPQGFHMRKNGWR